MEKTGFGQLTAMGGVHIAMSNDSTAPMFVNAGNPASYPSQKYTAFEVGVQNTYSTFYTATQRLNKNNATLSYGTLGFPVTRRAGMALGLLPFSNVGYKITNTKEVEHIGILTEQYEGNGGLNSLFAGIGIKPFYAPRKKSTIGKLMSNLSVGANASYLFGDINNTGKLIYPEGAGVNNTKRSRDTEIRDFYFRGGLQMHLDFDSVRNFGADSNTARKRDLREDIRITLGYTVSLPRTIHATATTLNTTFIYGAFEREYTRDTISYESHSGGTIQLPIMHGLGLTIKKGDKLTISAEAEIQQWSAFRYYNETNTFKDARRLAIGAQFVPDKRAIGNGAYAKRIHYRIGARYNDGYLELKNTRISDMALTAGAALPLGPGQQFGRTRLFSYLNLTIECGQVGTLSNKLVQQKYIRGVIGFTFNDKWFIPRKYD